MMPSTYSFIVPAYNESERLAVSLPKILDYVHQQQLPSEIIVVNDGSTDDTAEVVAPLYGRQSRRSVGRESGQSWQRLQRAQRHAACHRRCDAVHRRRPVLADLRGRQAICGHQQGADVAIGSRWLQAELQTERQPWYRQLYGRLFNFALRRYAGIEVSRHAMRLQGIHASSRAERFSPASVWSAGASIRSCCSWLTSSSLRTVEVPVEWAHDHRSKISPCATA